MEFAGNRGDFTVRPFTGLQLEQLEAMGRAEVEADPAAVAGIIDQAGEQPAVPPEVVRGEKNVADFEPATDFLPAGTRLLVTGKGWDPTLKDQLTRTMVGGASVGVSTCATEAPLETVTGFMSLVPVPDTAREAFTVTPEDIQANRFIRSPLIQPRACAVADGRLHCLSENNVTTLGADGSAATVRNEAIGTAHDISFAGPDMAVASSDTDQIVVLDRATGELRRTLPLIDHGYRLTIGELGGTDEKGLYTFPDQAPDLGRLPPSDLAMAGIRALLADRLQTQKVSVREQTTHVNSVQYLTPDTMLATVFNSAVVDEAGSIRAEPGGKVVAARFDQYAGTGHEEPWPEPEGDATPWTVVTNEEAYTLPGQPGTVRRTTYGHRPGQSRVVREISDGPDSYTSVETVTTLADGLRNPHSVAVIGRTEDTATLSVSNTSAGEIAYYELRTPDLGMDRIGGLDFHDLPGAPDSGNQWIHHVVEPTVLPDGDVVTTVFDGARNGIHILNLTREQRMFVPVDEAAVVYQTQLVMPRKADS